MDYSKLDKYVAAHQANQPVAPAKKGNWLVNLLPTAGGIVGGIGGGLLGSLGAGVGAVPGAAAGGAAGSALGEFLRQKLSGESGVGYKKIATEAALGGIPLGVGKGLKAGEVAMQGSKGLIKNAAESAAAKSATKRTPVQFAEAAGMTTAKGGMLQKLGKNIQSWSRDVKANLPHPEIPGKTIGGARADRVNKLASEKIFTGKNAYVSGDKKARAVEGFIANSEKNFANSAEGKRVVDASVHQDMLKQFDQSLANSPSLQTKAAKDFAANVRKLVLEKPPQTVNDWKQLLSKVNKEYSANLGADTAGTAQKRVYENARQAIKNTFDKLSPEGAKVNQEMSDAKLLSGVIGKAGRRELNTMSGLVARGAEAVKSGAEPIGRLIERAGAGVSTPIGKIIGRETVPRMMLGGGAMAAPTTPQTQMPTDLQSLMGGGDATGADQEQQAQESQSMYPQENYMYDVMRDMQTTGGKNVANLTNIYKTMNASATTKPMSAEAAKVSSYVKTGLEDVGQLANYIQNNPDINKRTLIPGRGIAGNLGNNILGTADYESIRGQAMDSIARLRTGAAISQSEEKRFMSMLPAPMDSQEVAMAKLQRLASEFQNVLQKTGAAGNDTQQTLMDLYGASSTQQ